MAICKGSVIPDVQIPLLRQLNQLRVDALEALSFADIQPHPPFFYNQTSVAICNGLAIPDIQIPHLRQLTQLRDDVQETKLMLGGF